MPKYSCNFKSGPTFSFRAIQQLDSLRNTYWFIFILSMFLPSLTRAEHIIGAEMYYTCVSGNTYEITLKLYRDCNSSGAQFDNPATFGIFNGANNLVFSIQSFVADQGNIEPDLSSPCLAIPPDVCIEQGTYIFEVTMPDAAQAYTVVYQRCCRNQTIQNLTNPGAQGLSVLGRIPPSSEAICNSKARYNNFPPPVLCAQEFLQFDHSATDPDGDSLSYKLCSPFIGGSQAEPAPNPPDNPPYNQVTWGGGFSAINPINASPGLSINATTGLLTGTPTQLGQFVVGVCVEEWRNGILLSTNTRDFQFNVAFCEPSSTALIGQPSIEDLCDDLFFAFINNSNPVNVFAWDFGDPSTDTDVSSAYSPVYTYPDTGTYVVTLVTNPGFFCSDTVQITLPLYAETSINAIPQGFICVNGQTQFEFTSSGAYNENQAIITWDFGPNASSQTANTPSVSGITFSSFGPQTINVSVVDGVCEGQDQIVVDVVEPPSASIIPQNLFCNGLNYQFSQVNTNGTIFQWDFGVVGTDSDVATGPQAGFTFPAPGVYSVTLTASNPATCPATTTEDFDIHTLLAPDVQSLPVQCFDGHSVSLEAGGSFSSAASFIWTFPSANVAGSSVANPAGITYAAPGIYTVHLSISENGCTRVDSARVNLHANPTADFNVPTAFGCAPLSVQFVDESFTQSSSVLYEWDFGDGLFSNSRNPLHVFTEPGIYSVSLKISNLNGCIDSDVHAVNDVVEVVPSPIAGFKIEPGTVSAINPEMEIIDLSQGSVSCSYFFDNQLFETCSFEHFLQNVEPQDVTQTVQNEFGCVDRITGRILISDHLIFIPNAFSPDGDGLNDIFRPVASGLIELEMYIYNRWGQQVFHRSGLDVGWNGASVNEDYFSEAGVYQYVIRLKDNSLSNFEYKGSVRLLR